MRALIAVPAYPLIESARIERFNDDAVAVPAAYVHALRRAGGVEAILLPTPLEDGEADDLLSRYDGLMLLGGGDLEPAAYGHDPHDKVYEVNPDRDANELALARTALDLGMPILAICRGHQVLTSRSAGRSTSTSPGAKVSSSTVFRAPRAGARLARSPSPRAHGSRRRWARRG